MSRFSSFSSIWCLVTVKLQEDHGLLDDADIIRQLKNKPLNPSEQIQQRAQLLAQNNGVQDTINNWMQRLQFSKFMLIILAVVIGVSSAINTFAGSNQVNIFSALLVLVGLHLLSFIWWLISFAGSNGSNGSNGSGLAGVSKIGWIISKWRIHKNTSAQSRLTHLTLNSLRQWFSQIGLWRWLAGLVSHGFWCVIFSSAIVTTIILLSIKRYQFGWETTILNTQDFINLIQALSIIPSWLGFPQPSTEMIVLGNGLYEPIINDNGLMTTSLNTTTAIHNQVISAHTWHQWQSSWSYWLIGIIFVYGFLLRLLSLGLCWLVMRQRLKHSYQNILTQDAIYSQAVWARFDKNSGKNSEYKHLGIDAPEPRLSQVVLNTPSFEAHAQLILGFELSNTPDFITPEFIQNIKPWQWCGLVDNREERKQILDQLQPNPIAKLIVLCNAQLTPDRGSLLFLRQIQQYTQELNIAILNTEEYNSKQDLWQEQLQDALPQSKIILNNTELNKAIDKAINKVGA